MSNGKRLTGVAAVLALWMLIAGTADAVSPVQTATVPVSAVVQAAGSGRVMTVTPSSIALVSVNGTSTMTGTVVADVVETLAAGSNGWTVTAQLQGPFQLSGNSSVTMTAGSLTLSPSPLVASGGLSTMVQTDQAVSMVMGSASQSLASSANLFTVNGENSGAFNGTYHGVGNLTLSIPSGTSTGTYNATMTVTLSQ